MYGRKSNFNRFWVFDQNAGVNLLMRFAFVFSFKNKNMFTFFVMKKAVYIWGLMHFLLHKTFKKLISPKMFTGIFFPDFVGTLLEWNQWRLCQALAFTFECTADKQNSTHWSTAYSIALLVLRDRLELSTTHTGCIEDGGLIWWSSIDTCS